MCSSPRHTVWLCSTILPAVSRRLGRPYEMWIPWVSRLLEEYRSRSEDKISIVTASAHGPIDFTEDGIRYIVVRKPRRLFHWFGDSTPLDKLTHCLHGLNPDLIHVHGTESSLGLVPSMLGARKPVVVGLQGLMNECQHHALGGIPLREIIKSDTLVDTLRSSGMYGLARSWQRAAIIEKEIILKNSHFLGRTTWDKTIIKNFNPSAHYYHVGEILRVEFTASSWLRQNSMPLSIFFGNAGGAHKGAHTTIRALKILKNRFPKVRFRIGGRVNPMQGYGKYLNTLAVSEGVRDNIEFLGFLSGEQVADELRRATIFVSASFVENSPNSVAEAMLVGTPIVSTAVGGVPEMLDNGKAGLLVPPNDPIAMATAIEGILLRPETTEARCRWGVALALKRHSPKQIIGQLREAYNSCYEGPTESRS
jgi:glycosyltransferase involved in cell wall biosynthesis